MAEITDQQLAEGIEVIEAIIALRNKYGVKGQAAELLYVADLTHDEIVIALALMDQGHDIRYAVRHAHRSVMQEDLLKSIDSR